MNRRAIGGLILGAMLLAACDGLSLPSPVSEDGPYLIVEIDADALQQRALDDLTDTMAQTLQTASPSIRYSGRGVADGVARIQLADAADMPRALEALATHAEAAFTPSNNGVTIEARPNRAAVQAALDAALPATIAVLERRLQPLRATVAPYGVQQILIRSQGDAAPDQVRAMVSQGGHLTFHMVREISPTEMNSDRLPPGTMLAQPYLSTAHPEVVVRRPRLTGENLVRAAPTADEFSGEFVLSFQLDQAGSQTFCQITRQYTGQRFAILLDNRVITAPTINEAIGGGSGQISGGFTPQSAQALAIILNAGALPAPITIVAEGVGPTP